MTLAESNKLIAEFMGYPVYKSEYKFGRKNKPTMVNMHGTHITLNQLKYHKSYEWLMEVVEKIEMIETIDVDILTAGTRIYEWQAGGKVIVDNVGLSFSRKMEHVYDGVVKFIQWYNLNNTKMSKVKSVTYNWHQAGSVQDREGIGENWERFTVGEKGVKSIEEIELSNGTQNYIVHLKDGKKFRIFNPNFIEYFSSIENEQLVKDFPNGFLSWAETHHLVVEMVTLKDGSGGLVDEQEGMTGKWQLARDLTDEFEEKNKGEEWIDREYIEEVLEFLKSKNL